MKTAKEILKHHLMKYDNGMRLTQEDRILHAMEEYAEMYSRKKFIKLEIDHDSELPPDANLPTVVVFAINESDESMVGYLRVENDIFICESDVEMMEDVTYYMLIPKLNED